MYFIVSSTPTPIKKNKQKDQYVDFTEDIVGLHYTA